MNDEIIKSLEMKVCKLDDSMVKMADAMSDFIHRQATLDERSIHILDQLRQQQDATEKLRDMVIPLAQTVHDNKGSLASLTKIVTTVILSGSAGGALVKLFGQ